MGFVTVEQGERVECDYEEPVDSDDAKAVAHGDLVRLRKMYSVS